MKSKFLMSLLFSCLSAEYAVAQTSVSSMTETTEFIPGDEQRRDYNNQACALVKVQVLDDIAEVEGNVMGDIVNRGVEKWVYMAQGSRNMKIHLKNNLPVTVKFKDYGFASLQSNRVYSLVLNAPNQPKMNESVKGNNLQLQVSPSNANVAIWGDNHQKKVYRPDNDGLLSIYLPYGRYHYSVTANGYYDKEGSVFVNDENKTEYLSLEIVKGKVTIVSLTPDVELLINSESQGVITTQWSSDLLPGEYTVTIAKRGYVAQSKEINVAAFQVNTLQFDKLLTFEEQSAIELKKKEEIKSGVRTDLNSLENQRRLSYQNSQDNNEVPNKEKTVSLGIRAGVNMASIGIDSKAGGTCSMVPSFHAGLSADIRLANPIHLYASLLYSQKGYDYKNSENFLEEKGTAQFVMLPVQLSLRLNVFQINVGPYIEYGIGGKIEFNQSGQTDTFGYYDPLNYGVTAGVGVLLGNHFFIGANYELGLSGYANRNITISLGYYF